MKPATNLSELIREPEKVGWKVIGFHSLMSGRWVALLSGPEARSSGRVEFAEADTPEEAMASAIENMNTARARGFTSSEEKRAWLVWEGRVASLAGTTRKLFR